MSGNFPAIYGISFRDIRYEISFSEKYFNEPIPNYLLTYLLMELSAS
jgi:hypothetical protein